MLSLQRRQWHRLTKAALPARSEEETNSALNTKPCRTRMHNLPRALGLLLPTGLELFRPAEPSSRSRQAGRPSRAAVQETKGGQRRPTGRSIRGIVFAQLATAKKKQKYLWFFIITMKFLNSYFPMYLKSK